MLVSCWSAKGGSGTTVVAAALALVLTRSSPGGVLLADCAGGDLPAVLGVPEPSGPGLAAWLSAGDDVAPDALARIEVAVAPGLQMLPWGEDDSIGAATGSAGSARGEVLAAALASDARTVVVDCGAGPVGAALAIVATATRSLLVTRPCYLALRRALAAPVRPSGIVLVTEPGRSLTRRDVESVLGVPVCAEIAIDAAIARAVDAGVLVGRLPRTLERGLRRVA